MTVGATNIVAPVFAAPEIVMFFSTRVARETGFGSFFRRFVFERNNLRRITLFTVSLARPMARFAAGYLALPTANLGNLGMRGMREGLELIFVAVLTGIAADIIFGLITRGFDLF